MEEARISKRKERSNKSITDTLISAEMNSVITPHIFKFPHIYIFIFIFIDILYILTIE